MCLFGYRCLFWALIELMAIMGFECLVSNLYDLFGLPCLIGLILKSWSYMMSSFTLHRNDLGISNSSSSLLYHFQHLKHWIYLPLMTHPGIRKVKFEGVCLIVKSELCALCEEVDWFVRCDLQARAFYGFCWLWRWVTRHHSHNRVFVSCQSRISFKNIT